MKKKRTYTYKGVKSDRPWTAARKRAFDRGFEQGAYPYRYKLKRFASRFKSTKKKGRKRKWKDPFGFIR